MKASASFRCERSVLRRRLCRSSPFLAAHARARLRRPSFLPRSSLVSSAMAICFLASARATARMARWTDERGMPVPSAIIRTDKPGRIRSSTTRRRRAVSLRVPAGVPGLEAFWAMFGSGGGGELLQHFWPALAGFAGRLGVFWKWPAGAKRWRMIGPLR